MQEEISLVEIFQFVKQNLVKLVLTTVVGAVVAVAFTLFVIQPKYSSDMQLLVNQSNTENKIQYNEVQTNLQMINTYRDLLTGQSVLMTVSDEVDGVYSLPELKKAISISQSTNSQAFYVTVTLPSSKDAQIVAQALLKAFDQTIKEAYGEDKANIYVVSEPSYNPNKVSPSITKYGLMGAIVGLLIGLAWAFIALLTDTSVRDGEFVTRLGLTQLGEIFDMSDKEIKEARIGSVKPDSNRRKV